MGESVLRDREAPFQMGVCRPPIERESGQNSGTRMWTFDGNVNELGDAGRSPGKSFLFSLTAYNREIKLFGATVQWLVELGTSAGSGALLTALENPRE